MTGVALTPLDTKLGIDWPIEIDPADRDQISEKDSKPPPLEELRDQLK